MAGISLLTAQTELDGWLAASAAVKTGQRYTINGRELYRTDAKEIRDSIEFWNSKVITLSNQARGRSRARTVVVG